ncbi:MAG TPA: proton-conducting transporter membrane subunit [Candidatus Dormibacteraeota bacterium]|nr:proton-conducting transporter membrane subunit [Candidatus Dormibacteraeota bacterium]
MTTFGNLLAFSPELWLLLGAIVIVALGRVSSAQTTTRLALVTLVLAFAALATQFKQTITILDGAFVLDGFAIVVDVIILATVALAVLASRADILPGDSDLAMVPAFYLLVALGAMLAASATQMISLFVSLELLAVNLYILTGLLRRGRGSVGIALGYAVIGAATSGLLLYALALLFGLTGELQLGAAGTALKAVRPGQPAVLLMLSLLIGGFALRLGLLPVRWWLRGFESGVSLRVVLLVQSVGVVAAFAVFGRVLAMTFAGTQIAYAPVLAGLAAILMTAGTFLSITQTSLRRLLSYSAIAQAGFALAAFTDLKGAGLSALLVFMVALALTTVGAFAAVIAYSRSVHSDAIRDLAGLVAPTPGVALALGLALLSIAGAPPLAGFLGKLLILQATVDGGYAWLAVIGVVNIVIATLGYARLIRTLFVDPPVFEVVPVRLDLGIRAAVAIASASIVFMVALMEPLYRAAGYGRSSILH